MRILRCGVDTVRQHYRGMLRPDVLPMFEDQGFVEFAGEIWHKGRVGRDSGYQYKLQNADLGVILLIKNFNPKADSHGPHLKIEISPHAIECRSHGELQKLMDGFATAALSAMERNQCAVHLALDVQGWTPPDDIAARMHCRARAQRNVHGINEIEWATTYLYFCCWFPTRPGACGWPACRPLGSPLYSHSFKSRPAEAIYRISLYG